MFTWNIFFFRFVAYVNNPDFIFLVKAQNNFEITFSQENCFHEKTGALVVVFHVTPHDNEADLGRYPA